MQTRLILNFECITNEITILDKTFEISFVESSPGKYKQHAEFVNTTKEKIEEIKLYIDKEKNSKGWKY